MRVGNVLPGNFPSVICNNQMSSDINKKYLTMISLNHSYCDKNYCCNYILSDGYRTWVDHKMGFLWWALALPPGISKEATSALWLRPSHGAPLDCRLCTKSSALQGVRRGTWVDQGTWVDRDNKIEGRKKYQESADLYESVSASVQKICNMGCLLRSSFVFVTATCNKMFEDQKTQMSGVDAFTQTTNG